VQAHTLGEVGILGIVLLTVSSGTTLPTVPLTVCAQCASSCVLKQSCLKTRVCMIRAKRVHPEKSI